MSFGVQEMCYSLWLDIVCNKANGARLNHEQLFLIYGVNTEKSDNKVSELLQQDIHCRQSTGYVVSTVSNPDSITVGYILVFDQSSIPYKHIPSGAIAFAWCGM